MSIRVVLYILILCSSVVHAAAQRSASKTLAAPAGMDSLPPRITLQPAPGYYPAPLTVMFSTDEHAQVHASAEPGIAPVPLSGGVTVLSSGSTRIRYWAVDDWGNRTPLDSAEYVIDLKSPSIALDPPPGVFASSPVVHVTVDEPVRLLRHSRADLQDTIGWRSEFPVSSFFSGYLSAIDRAGNISTTPYLSYIVDTSRIMVNPSPAPGTYNATTFISFAVPDSAAIYWTFNTIAGPEQFNPYVSAVECPAGASRLRWYARRGGRQSAICEADYIVDTVAPRLRVDCTVGPLVDTLVFSCREKADVRYMAGEAPFRFEDATPYRTALLLPHTGRALYTAAARDPAGNVSRRTVFEKRYDTIPPTLRPSHASGQYNHLFLLSFTGSEPIRIFYTLDGSLPSRKSQMYGGVIPISAQGKSTVRYIAYDDAGNASGDSTLEFDIDRTAPKIKARIEGDPGRNAFKVSLSADEDAVIRYAEGNGILDKSSPVYREPINMQAGQILRYYGVDKAGNSTPELTMRELTEPITAVEPDGGTFKDALLLHFKASLSASVFARVLPDTVFREIRDSLRLAEDGDFVVEYYALAEDGGRMPVRRSVYHLDLTSPQVKVSVRKGGGDSVSVFFECSENADIIYTLDGTDPATSRSMRIAGNKFSLSRDRISVKRNENARLSLFAEDAAGNRSSLTMLDIFRPTVIPGIPSGSSRIFDHIISVSLNTFDERSQIRYERHGKMPSPYSPLYVEPITLIASDTIKAFVVDASGYKGPLETMIYLIDLPPQPQFRALPDTGIANTAITFDASRTRDDESPLRDLTFSWDFDGDGRADISTKAQAYATHTFAEPGVYPVRLTVTDSRARSAVFEQKVAVRGPCPEGMVSVPRDSGRSFCIDRKASASAVIGGSWIDAFMTCRDVGRRLCTADEWTYACGGSGNMPYPYGRDYDPLRCTGKPSTSGACISIFGAADMLGTRREWVADKAQGHAAAMGGSAETGADAACNSELHLGIADPASETGYRCCR